MEENSKSNKGVKIAYILLLLLSIAIVVLARFLYQIGDLACFRILCFIILGNIIINFAVKTGSFYNDLLNKNKEGIIRFYVIYMIMLLLSTFLPFIPVDAWPIIVIFLLLTIISNLQAGILAGSICMMVSFSLGGSGYFSYFVFYFLCGMVVSLLFSRLDQEFKIGFPLLISEIILFTGLSIIIITSGGNINFEAFLFPIVNTISSLLLILLILKSYSNKVLFAEKDNYLELNNPECKLLTELKNSSPDDYKKTVHVVYFCDRLSRRLGLDENLVKCAGLYHKVGIIGGAKNWENTSMICTEQNLPIEVMNVLKEFLDPNVPIVSTEAAVLFMSDCIVNSVSYLFGKNKDIVLDYSSLVEAIFSQRIETGIFKQCNISINQFETMKKVFVEEKLYYDFLR